MSFVKDSICPPPILIILGFVSVEISRVLGSLVGMYRSGKVRKGRNVKEKPTIRRKLGFNLVMDSLGHRAQDV